VGGGYDEVGCQADGRYGEALEAEAAEVAALDLERSDFSLFFIH